MGKKKSQVLTPFSLFFFSFFFFFLSSSIDQMSERGDRRIPSIVRNCLKKPRSLARIGGMGGQRVVTEDVNEGRRERHPSRIWFSRALIRDSRELRSPTTTRTRPIFSKKKKEKGEKRRNNIAWKLGVSQFDAPAERF